MTYAGTAGWLRERLWMGWPVGLGVWVAWLGSLAVGGGMVDAEGTLVGVDHMAFYSAARLIRDGDPARMYDYATLGRYQGSLVGWEDWGTLVGYRNPPFYALLYVPTAGLPFVWSFLIWTAVGLGVLAAAVWWLRPEHPARVLLWSVTFYPVFAAVSFGQNSLLSLGVLAGVYRLLDDRRPFAAGLAAGLLWYKPQLLIGLFVWWALAPRRYLWCWAGVAVAGLVLAAVSWLAVPEGTRAFVDGLERNIGYGGENLWNKHAPRWFWVMLLPGAGPTVIWGLTAATVLPALAGAAWLARRTGAPVAVMFPVAVFLSLWASPHTLIYEWSLLIPATVVLWERFPERRDAWVCLFALAWLALAVSTTSALVQIKHLGWPVALQVSIPVLAVVAWLAFRELAGLRPQPAADTAGAPVASG